MIYFFIVSFFLYHVAISYYAAIILNQWQHRVKHFFLTLFTHFGLFFYYVHYLNPDYEFIAMLGFFLLLTVEFIVLYKAELVVAIYGALSFALNLFALRLVIFTLLAFYYDTSIFVVLSDQNGEYLASGLAFIITIPRILTVNKYLSKDILDQVFSHKKNILLATVLLAVVYFYLVSISHIFFHAPTGSFLHAISLKTGVFAICAYLFVSYLSLRFANLSPYLSRYNDLSKSVEKSKDEVIAITREVYTDYLTGFKVRDFITDEIDNYVQNKEKFYIVFIDMDGLKVVNDDFGHDEGDFYIVTIAQIISDRFSTEVIARLGGDEFLVIGKYEEEELVNKKVAECYQATVDIAKKHNKEYQTSISYGIEFVTSDNTLTTSQLISNADQKMYAFKKAKKKARTVTKIPKTPTAYKQE